jgi:hypothetical protein
MVLPGTQAMLLERYRFEVALLREVFPEIAKVAVVRNARVGP